MQGLRSPLTAMLTGAALAGCGTAAGPASTAAATPVAVAASAPERAWPYPVAAVHPALHLVGDSTMADKPPLPVFPERGWGQLLREFMLEPARLVNHAANGRSTRRFVDEGRWAHLLTQLATGDFVIIQFGHNDQKDDDPRRYAPAQTDFKAYLRSFIADVRAKGATPVLATSVARRKFGKDARVVQTLGDYPQALRDVAAETGVALIDMNVLTTEQIQALGPEASKALFMHIPPGRYDALPQGRVDDTHYVEQGARATAALAVQALRQQVPALRSWFKAP
jgi:lysophospholipase L1-like esterase